MQGSVKIGLFKGTIKKINTGNKDVAPRFMRMRNKVKVSLCIIVIVFYFIFYCQDHIVHLILT